MKTRLISIIAIIALLFSVASMGLISTYAAEPINPEDWTTEGGVNDQDFTLAFVGDIQSMTLVDYQTSIDIDPENDTAYVDTLFSWLANNAESKKIKHVFTLGDLTEFSSENDPNLSYAAQAAGGSPSASGTKEWQIVKSAIQKLDGVVPYSIVRGNHDDYQIDTFFNYEAYTKNFNGFYREDSGVYNNSITNSYKLVELGDFKFIFITLDFNPTRAVITWLDELLTKYSDYNAIITTHAFISEDLSLTTRASLQGVVVAGKLNGAAPDWIWKNCLTKHSNVVMTLCGHFDAQNIRSTTLTGDNGNQVLSIMVNPQVYDKKVEASGLVFLMHFYDGGRTVKAEYYSTILDLYKVGNSFTWELNTLVEPSPTTTEATTTTTPETTVEATTTVISTAEVTTADVTTTEAITTEVATTGAITAEVATTGATTPKTTTSSTTTATTPEIASTTPKTEATPITTTAPTTTEASAEENNGCNSSISLVSVALIPAFATFSAISLKKKKETR